MLRVFNPLEVTPLGNDQLYSQRSLGVDVAFGAPKMMEFVRDAKDLFVLTNGHTRVYRIDGTNGDLIWSWSAPEQTLVDGFLLISLSELIKPLVLSHPWAYCHRFHDIYCRTFDVLRMNGD